MIINNASSQNWENSNNSQPEANLKSIEAENNGNFFKTFYAITLNRIKNLN